ncbi:hypothetical protein BKA67DRAFT_658889 [Truncatella angustata]|uniref:C6 transcription factor n=1 Tax=Truncatella angustata TaxID=152316 RepID=A0A9P8ZXY7_9PEZI|nr:uncharacterized protein BKA67DRAFT_658889 [Truncatella angustata]KAH6654603.1 hypothetical protein BKA67DRAFT_658889 [Truncatella angustata]KAH8203351.1 hypothetical protein TruAng_002446 [Truncatella angustata]
MVTTRSASKAVSQAPNLWYHAPDRATLYWFAISLPLVIWDSIYVLGRPYTMEGGFLNWPLYVPYILYGKTDYVYGWKAYNERNGFTAAQGTLNVVETAMYLTYLYIYFGRGKPVGGILGGEKRVLQGRPAGLAALLAFSAAVMTLSKTVLYWANEYFSDFANIGHNSWPDLITLWIIPNGAWLVLPTYIIYVIGGEIIDGLAAASTGTNSKLE